MGVDLNSNHRTNPDSTFLPLWCSRYSRAQPWCSKTFHVVFIWKMGQQLSALFIKSTAPQHKRILNTVPCSGSNGNLANPKKKANTQVNGIQFHVHSSGESFKCVRVEHGGQVCGQGRVAQDYY